MQKEKPLTQAPQRRRTPVIALRQSLDDPVRQTRPHIVQQQIGIEMHSLMRSAGLSALPKLRTAV